MIAKFTYEHAIEKYIQNRQKTIVIGLTGWQESLICKFIYITVCHDYTMSHGIQISRSSGARIRLSSMLTSSRRLCDLTADDIIESHNCRSYFTYIFSTLGHQSCVDEGSSSESKLYRLQLDSMFTRAATSAYCRE